MKAKRMFRNIIIKGTYEFVARYLTKYGRPFPIQPITKILLEGDNQKYS